MALDFPASPSNGDTHQASNGIQYVFDSTKSQWKSQGEFSTGAIEAKKIDNISGSFNGNTKTFTLNSGGAVVKPQNSQSVLISLNGLVQEPGTAYTTSITTGQITFTSAPTSGTTFIGVVYSRLPISSSTTLSTTGGSMTGDIVFNSTQTFAIGGIQDGNTSQKGVVQLSTSTTSTSETLAATASAVKSVKDAIPSNLGDLSNVSSSSPSTNHVLKWSGSEWAPSAESGGGASTLGALTDVSSSTPGNGQVLKYNTASSQWEPGTDNTGGGSGGSTNLAAIASGAALTITSSSGDDASIPAATTSSWGVMTDEMFDKLDGIATGAEVNVQSDWNASSGDAQILNKPTIIELLDEDDLATNSATKAASQQSIKAYVDAADALKANLASPALTGTATAVNLTLSGNLIVNGTTTTIDTTTLTVEDKNIELGKVSTPTDTTADGGGLTLKGATDKTFNWVNATDAWTSSEHIHLGDNKKLIVGDGSDLQLYHNGTNSVLKSDTGLLSLQADNYYFGNNAATEQLARMYANGAVELYYDNVKKLETTSSGVSITGNIVGSADVDILGHVLIDNGKYLKGVMQGHGDKIIGGYASGSTTLSIGESATLTVGGLLTSTSVADSKGNLRDIPQNTQGSAYTLVAADAGKHILASGNITVPDSVFSAGQAITIINNTGGDLTINKGTNMYNAADGSSANRTLATRGMATILFTAADTSYISGAGLT